MSKYENILRDPSHIEAKIKYKFKDPKLLALAFVHRSYVNEHREEVDEHNERLEFLGDAILGMIVANQLYHACPKEPEGTLSDLRSKTVDANACVSYVKALGIEDYLLLGKGEKKNSGKGRKSILADLFESVIAAIYLDGGIEEAEAFFLKHFSKNLEASFSGPIGNAKAMLQNYTQKMFQCTPNYEVVKEEGPDHDKFFEIAVVVGEKEIAKGSGHSKKEAQRSAAKAALEALKEG